MPKELNTDSMFAIGWQEGDVEFFLKLRRDGRLLPCDAKGIKDPKSFARVRCIDSAITLDSVRHVQTVFGHNAALVPIVPPGGPVLLSGISPLFRDHKGFTHNQQDSAETIIAFMRKHNKCGRTCIMKPHAPCAACGIYGVTLQESIEIYTPAAARWMSSLFPDMECPIWPHVRLGTQTRAEDGQLETDMMRTYMLKL